MSAPPLFLPKKQQTPLSTPTKLIGGFTHPHAIPNFFYSTKIFTLDIALGGLTQSVDFDLTDTDQDPAGLVSICHGLALPFKEYWARRLMKTAAVEVGFEVDGVSAHVAVGLFTSPMKAADDGLYYVFGQIGAGGGDGDDAWGLTSTVGGSAVATFQWGDTSTPLYGEGAGASGVITLKPKSAW